MELNCPNCGKRAPIGSMYGIIISPAEILSLKNYFLRAGYISHEFDEPVFAIMKRLDEYEPDRFEGK